MITHVEKNQLEECAEVIWKSFSTVAEEFDITPQNAPRFTAFAVTAQRLEQQLCKERRPMFVFLENGAVVGYCSLLPQGEACELNNLCVLPEYRHKGIGEALLSHACETARAAGCKRVTIGIVEENSRLKSWYQRLGFIHTGTRKFDFFPFTCGYMEKQL